MARSRGDSPSEAKPAARSDAYTGLLLIALLAQIAGCVFFWMDWKDYPKTKPALPPKQTAPATPSAGGQGGGQQGAQVGGQQGAQQGGPAGAGGAAGMQGKP